MIVLKDDRVACRSCGSAEGWQVRYNKFRVPTMAECQSCGNITTNKDSIQKLEMTYLREVTEHMKSPISRAQGDKFEAAVSVLRDLSSRVVV